MIYLKDFPQKPRVVFCTNPPGFYNLRSTNPLSFESIISAGSFSVPNIYKLTNTIFSKNELKLAYQSLIPSGAPIADTEQMLKDFNDSINTQPRRITLNDL